MALIFIPHWSAVCFVFPLVCVLFVDLIGVIQWAGLHLNPVSYVCLTMSIGLVVDYLMHVLFRYYEVCGNRVEKTIEMLRTMGASILLGGATTFLGIIPLMFSVSDVFETVFFTFMGIVVLGMGHSLILLPVLLSIFGPEETVSMNAKKKTQKGLDFADGNYPDRFEKDGRAYAMETVCWNGSEKGSICGQRSSATQGENRHRHRVGENNSIAINHTVELQHSLPGIIVCFLD